LLLDCFSRGLLREALGQLAGLKRRKLTLEMLGAAIQTGLDQQDAANKREIVVRSSTAGSQKRKLEVDDNQSEQQQQQQTELDEPAAKKMRTETI
jgi:hypothetical protein